MTSTTVISLDMAMVTLFRQPAELPPVHRRQQSAVCEPCQSLHIPFVELFNIQEFLKRKT